MEFNDLIDAVLWRNIDALIPRHTIDRMEHNIWLLEIRHSLWYAN